MKHLLILCALLFGAYNVDAQSVNPTQNSVKEEQLLKALKDGQVSGRASIPDERAGSIIRPEGRDWAFSGTTKTISAIAIIGMLLGLIAFYLVRGKIKIAGGASGKTLLRFNTIERTNHWMTATSFILLGLSGLNVTFGRSVVMPLLGAENFSGLSAFFKLVHNFLGWPFMIGVILMFLFWAKDNIPNAMDIAWLKKGGGLFNGEHIPAKRFNAGQKIMFWTVILGGTALSITGLLLLFPAGNAITLLQDANLIHGLTGAVMFAIMIAHAYIGSVGMEGAVDAMTTGEVDVNWAKDHHGLWVNEVQGKMPAE
jgi:formate dehydrogenase subunit gamma